MTKAEFEAFYEQDIANYAEENIGAGRWSRREATKLSRQAHVDILPKGRGTRGHHFLVAKDQRSGSQLGTVWLALRGNEAFIYYIEVERSLRGRGLGAELLKATEAKGRSLGASKISLHVFCHNKRAFALYKSAGYKIVSANMSKRI